MSEARENPYATLVAQAREAISVLPEEDRELRPIAFDLVLQHMLKSGNGVKPAPAKGTRGS